MFLNSVSGLGISFFWDRTLVSGQSELGVSRQHSVLVLGFETSKKNGVYLPPLEYEDTTLLKNVSVRLPTQ